MKKQYRLWELMKMAAEYNGKSEYAPRFKDVNSGQKVTFTLGTKGIIDVAQGTFLSTNRANSVFEKISTQTKVEFIEAIKAFKAGKTIKGTKTSDGIGGFIYKSDDTGQLLDQCGNAISAVEILQCDWYIVEDDDNE